MNELEYVAAVKQANESVRAMAFTAYNLGAELKAAKNDKDLKDLAKQKRMLTKQAHDAEIWREIERIGAAITARKEELEITKISEEKRDIKETIQKTLYRAVAEVEAVQSALFSTKESAN